MVLNVSGVWGLVFVLFEGGFGLFVLIGEYLIFYDGYGICCVILCDFLCIYSDVEGILCVEILVGVVMSVSLIGFDGDVV